MIYRKILKIIRYSGFLSVLALSACVTTDPSSTASSRTTQQVPQVSKSDIYTNKDYITQRSVDLTVDPDDIWSRIRMGFAIPDLDNQLVRDWEKYYSKRPEYLKRTSERAGKYMFYIVEEINRRGLPTELALLPYVESSFNPGAYSTAKAAGLWQFIPSTGKQYKLQQDWWRDLRRDPIASTDAALNYLTYLYEFQGDWHLALASYNWGEGSVARAIRKNEAANLSTDYWSLTMPNETRNYIPKLQAIKNIISDPARFGVTLPKVQNEPYFVAVQSSQKRDLDINIAAKLADMSVEEFKQLNPSYNRNVILADHQPRLLLPKDKLHTFKNNLASYDGPLSSWGRYTVQEEDTLESIAKQNNINVATLALVNGLSPASTIYKGDNIIVPPSDSNNLKPSSNQASALNETDRKNDIRQTTSQAGVPNNKRSIATKLQQESPSRKGKSNRDDPKDKSKSKKDKDGAKDKSKSKKDKDDTKSKSKSKKDKDEPVNKSKSKKDKDNAKAKSKSKKDKDDAKSRSKSKKDRDDAKDKSKSKKSETKEKPKQGKSK